MRKALTLVALATCFPLLTMAQAPAYHPIYGYTARGQQELAYEQWLNNASGARVAAELVRQSGWIAGSCSINALIISFNALLDTLPLISATGYFLPEVMADDFKASEKGLAAIIGGGVVFVDLAYIVADSLRLHQPVEPQNVEKHRRYFQSFRANYAPTAHLARHLLDENTTCRQSLGRFGQILQRLQR